MRLIDGDALSAKMYHEAFETDTDFQRWDSGCWIRYKMFENALKDAPTIEPEQRKGEWIDTNEADEWYGDLYRCSVCGGVMIGKTDYCPDCGCRMKEVVT